MCIIVACTSHAYHEVTFTMSCHLKCGDIANVMTYQLSKVARDELWMGTKLDVAQRGCGHLSNLQR